MGVAYRSQLLEVSTSGKDDGVFAARSRGSVEGTSVATPAACGGGSPRACGSPTAGKRCVSFSDDHGYPLERFHVIESRKDSFMLERSCIPLGMARNTADIITNAGLVFVMLCVVVGTYVL